MNKQIISKKHKKQITLSKHMRCVYDVTCIRTTNTYLGCVSLLHDRLENLSISNCILFMVHINNLVRLPYGAGLSTKYA